MQPDLLVGTTRLLHECKGAPLAILIALLAWRKPAPQTMVQRMTGYNAETVRIGLETLESLGYAQRAGELGWLLSAEARQLPLFGTEALEPAAENPRLAAGDDGNDPAAGDAQGEKHTPFYEGEGGAENPRLGSSSGGCLIVKSINALKPPPPPPTTATAENPRLAAGDDELVELLVARTACPRRRARAGNRRRAGRRVFPAVPGTADSALVGVQPRAADDPLARPFCSRQSSGRRGGAGLGEIREQ